MFNTILGHESQVFVNGLQLAAIDAVEVGYSNSLSSVVPLGMNVRTYYINGPSQKTFNITKSLIYDDSLYLTESTGVFSGSVHYNGISYGFNSGFITEYNVNCAVGSIPKASTNFSIFGDMDNAVSASGTEIQPAISIPQQGSIFVTCDNTSSNRVVGFDYSVKANLKPTYSVGQTNPVEITLVGPLEYAASVQLEVDDASLNDANDLLRNVSPSALSFVISGDNGAIQSFSITNPKLVGEQLSVSADGALKLTLNYV